MRPDTYRNHDTDRFVAGSLLLFGSSLLLLAFWGQTPAQAFGQLAKIALSPCGLITDYIAFAGWGGAFLNAGLVTLFAVALAWWFKAPFGGTLIAGVFISGGFALFGKNILNVWPIYLGVWLYTRYRHEPFSKHLALALFGTALGPLVSEMLFLYPQAPWVFRLALALGTGVLIGFLLPPISSHVFQFHRGFNLYNVGFAAGLIGAVAVSLLRSFGYTPIKMFYWADTYNGPLALYLGGLFLTMCLLGWRMDPTAWPDLRYITRHSGHQADFIQLVGFPATMVNMGLVGLLGTGYILLIGGQLNGPTAGTILAVAGFGAAGLNLRNTLATAGGVVLGSFVKIWNLTDPAVQLSVLLCTGLAPFSGRFGLGWGLLAGFLHSSLVMNVGSLYSALNLYNNGFSTGLVAALLAPIAMKVGHPMEDAPPPHRPERQTLSGHLEHLAGRRVDLLHAPLGEAEAKEICNWRYPGPSHIYDYPRWEDAQARNWAIADPVRRSQQFTGLFRDGKLVGFFRLSLHEEVVRLSFALHPDWISQGLGAPLLELAARRSRQLYPDRHLELVIEEWNQRVIGLAEEAGYQQRERFYRQSKRGEDGWFLRMRLPYGRR